MASCNSSRAGPVSLLSRHSANGGCPSIHSRFDSRFHLSLSLCIAFSLCCISSAIQSLPILSPITASSTLPSLSVCPFRLRSLCPPFQRARREATAPNDDVRASKFWARERDLARKAAPSATTSTAAAPLLLSLLFLLWPGLCDYRFSWRCH